jgi:glycosyltransferase involved in cell wall biosynthesis
MKNKPKVLLYGTNYASVINSLARGFAESGVPVRAVSFDYKRSQYNIYSCINCICGVNNPGRLRLMFYKIKGLFVVIRHLLWCDVAHIYGSHGRFIFWVIGKLAKNKFVTFLGSDIRVAKKELAVNPYYQFAFYNKDYENKADGTNDADALVKYLHDLGYAFIVWDVGMFINRAITNKVAIVPHASVNMVDAPLPATDAGDKKVLIIHSPTAPVSKGTDFVLNAISKLKEKNIPFEFTILRNLTNEKYQQALQEADIYVDQLIWGAYGVATQQALQMGKVVVAYLAPERVRELYGEEVPIQNATIDNLAEVLEKLVNDKALRMQLAERSRAYYQKMHEPQKVAVKMLAAYNTFMK